MTQGWDIDTRISGEWERTVQVGRAWYRSIDFFASYITYRRLSTPELFSPSNQIVSIYLTFCITKK